MTKFKSLHPVLWTESWEETIQFYTGILGFTITEKNQIWKWASLQRDGIRIMVSVPNAHESIVKIGFTGSFYFNISMIDDFWETLKDKIEICYEIEDFEWGMREFAVYDNNGYILQFGEAI
ncbi:VOC family protein [Chryseobacterium shandongense]|nr:VOC family protein [Chryseobacterium shandongense]